MEAMIEIKLKTEDKDERKSTIRIVSAVSDALYELGLHDLVDMNSLEDTVTKVAVGAVARLRFEKTMDGWSLLPGKS